ncbi:shikimate kinase [Sphaerochaeta sp. PS]|uniref:shikimate kinase n=1 Tax=Sphaerochaeta sp. PS TaxID=3076336 RepID=UPI0028A3458F|nr:shikimate kinase [Sphaerochaeta sp. PS]MDT4762860.1 shikimate kinase [Sphaerochaeta sp. PS]
MDTILFFCGIKHSGKTSLGNLVAKKMGLSCKDNDQLILQEIPGFPSIRSFYTAKGKEAFMEKEKSVLEGYLRKNPQPCIISLGGGACDNQRLVSLIKSRGKVIYLRVPEKVLLRRILVGGVPPFLDPENVELSFSTLYRSRDELYGKFSDIVVELPDYPDIRDTAEFLFSRLSEEL